MRKRDIAMARAYLAFYILFVFSGAIAPMLCFRFAPALSIVLIVIEVICLGCFIASNVFYDKNNEKLLFIFAPASLGIFDLIIVVGLILEIVYSLQGKSAAYAWMISIASVLIFGLISFYVGRGLYRIKHPVEKIY